MSTMIDIAASFFIGGMIMLVMLGVQTNLLHDSLDRNLDLATQENMSSVSRTVMHDFVKLGYGVPDTIDSILSADSVSIAFLSDMKNRGIIDTVTYAISSIGDASGTENPDDRLLYRRVNGTPIKGSEVGLIDFRLTYFDDAGIPATTLNDIRSVRVEVNIESLYTVDGRYARAEWAGMIRPRSLHFQ